MSDVKISNRAMILNQIKSSPKSRKDIAEKLKLTPAAITMLVGELMDQGCIRESGRVDESGRVGRRKVFIELNKEYRYVIGINIEGKRLNIGLGNLSYEIMASISESIDNMDPEQVIKLIIKLVQRLQRENRIDREKLLGIGVGIVGKVDTKRGISKHAYGLWDEEVSIKVMLEETLGIPVVVENNVRALALAEMELTPHKKISNMVFLKLGPGIGSAVILENEIYKGAHDDAGELGHMTIDLEGKQCQCGQRGCLETMGSVASLLADIRDEYKAEKYPLLSANIRHDLSRLNETALIEAYLEGDSGVVAKIERMMVYLTAGIMNSIKLYDPHRLVLYSEMFNEPVLYKRLMKEISKRQGSDSIESMIEPSNLLAPKCVGGVVLCANRLFYNRGAMIE